MKNKEKVIKQIEEIVTESYLEKFAIGRPTNFGYTSSWFLQTMTVLVVAGVLYQPFGPILAVICGVAALVLCLMFFRKEEQHDLGIDHNRAESQAQKDAKVIYSILHEGVFRIEERDGDMFIWKGEKNPLGGVSSNSGILLSQEVVDKLSNIPELHQMMTKKEPA